MERDFNVVWVLGSGFSKSLGGPLLNELLSISRRERLLHADTTVSAIHWGEFLDQWAPFITLFDQDKTERQRQPWANAEEFIELLELASRSTKSGLMSELTKGVRGDSLSMRDVAIMGRKYIAAVTHEFVASSDPAMERWAPYRRWAERLDDRDNIISFNYDLVVETAAKAVNVQIQRTELSPDAKAQLHKVHGSVDWSSPLGKEQIANVSCNPFSTIVNGLSEVAIGVPGPGKQQASGKTFLAQWNAARQALTIADVIIFVGYRFPPTDSFARSELLNAIKANQQQDLTIRMVLGPQFSDDVLRLESLLLWSLRHRQRVDIEQARSAYHSAPWLKLIREPLYAEDFLAVFDPVELRD